MSGKFNSKILETNKDKNSPLIQKQYVFASDSDSKRLGLWINNSHLRKKLKNDSVLAKMVREYKIKYLKSVQFENGIFLINSDELEFYDLFVHANIACNAAKSFVRIREKKLITDREDLKILHNFVLESNIWFRSLFNGFKNKNIINSFHPYIKNVLSKNNLNHLEIIDPNDDYLFNLMSLDNYKKEEAIFIRSANSQSNRIENFFDNQFIRNKKIFVCRFDVIFNSSLEYKKLSVDDYRENVSRFLEKLPYFNSAVEVIFPSALLSGGIIPSTCPVGQIVLVATQRVGANKKALQDLASRVSCIGPLDFMPAKPFPKDLSPSVDGVLQFTPSAVEAINWLAEFLTIERRFVAPGKGCCTKGKGSVHCCRFIELNH